MSLTSLRILTLQKKKKKKTCLSLPLSYLNLPPVSCQDYDPGMNV